MCVLKFTIMLCLIALITPAYSSSGKIARLISNMLGRQSNESSELHNSTVNEQVKNNKIRRDRIISNMLEIHKALEDANPNKTAIINMLIDKNRADRYSLERSYNTFYNKNLIDDLTSLVSREPRELKEFITLLLTTDSNYFSKELHNALYGRDPDVEAILDILCGRTQKELRSIWTVYKNEHSNNTLKDELMIKISDNFTQSLLRQMLFYTFKGYREKKQIVNQDQATADAQVLYEMMNEQRSWNQTQFILILTNRSDEQLRQTFLKYKKHYGHDIEMTIEKKLSGTVKNLVQQVVKCTKPKIELYAEKLVTSMDRKKYNDDRLLMFIIVYRAGKDLDDIKEAFKKRYGESLESRVAKRPPSLYRNALLFFLLTHVGIKETIDERFVHYL